MKLLVRSKRWIARVGGCPIHWSAITLLMVLSATSVFGAVGVVLNEWLILHQPLATGYVELYNSSASPIDLTGFVLSGSPTNGHEYTFPPGTVIPAGGFHTLLESTYNPPPFNFPLPASGGFLGLFNSTGTLVDNVVYGPQQLDVSEGRVPDGGSRILALGRQTAGSRNALLVLNTNDSGAGSLRQALTDANGDPGPDTIGFNIPGSGPHVIQPQSALPNITDRVTLDGYTQSGASLNTLAVGNNAVLRIVVDGANANASGLNILTNYCVVRGLVIHSFAGHGIYAAGNNNIFAGNFIGTDNTGNLARTNGVNGIFLAQSSANLIGGSAPSERNVISANADSGVYITDIEGSANRVEGNYIGVNAAGNAALGNRVYGVRVNYSSGNIIGGSNPGAGNLISGNLYGGIGVWFLSAATVIEGNYVGTDATGRFAIPNNAGIGLQSNAGSRIGGTAPGARNIVSGNSAFGIAMSLSSSNVVEGNYVGTDVTGTLPLPNEVHGISIDHSASVRIGGTGPNAGNLISGNRLAGITVVGIGSSNALVQGNIIGLDRFATSAVPNGISFGYPGIDILEAPRNTVGGPAPAARNLISGNTGAGVRFGGTNATGNLVQNNFIGTDSSGLVGRGNQTGIDLNAPTNSILNNILSGNQIGIQIRGDFSGNHIQGNTLGLDAAGLNAVPNQIGINVVNASSNLIGGTSVSARNLISGNTTYGVLFTGGAYGNQLFGNFIGTRADGQTPVGNGSAGVVLDAAPGNFIGGPDIGQGNLISGNAIGANPLGGIYFIQASAQSNLVTGNRIGTDSTGTGAVPNNGAGIVITGARNNTIGGSSASAANTIAFNTAQGVVIVGAASSGNAITRNAIFSNAALGIDLDADGPTVNDPSDSDTGPNQLQNYPVLTAAASDDTGLVAFGTMQGLPLADVRLEFFANDTTEPSGFGEGKMFLGATNVLVGASGITTFTFITPSLVPHGQFITATATDANGNTSEFSSAQRVAGTLSLSVQGAGTIMANPNQPAYTFGQIVTLTASANNASYQFIGWSDGNPNSVRDVTIGDANQFTALFTNVVALETRVLKVWERVYGGSEDDSPVAVLPAGDGFLVVGGSVSGNNGNKLSPGRGGWDNWLVRVDAQGERLWERSFGTTNDELIISAIPARDFGYLLGIQSGLTEQDSALQLVKINDDGDIVWQRTYDGDGADYIYRVVSLRDGGCLLLAASTSGVGPDKTTPNFGNYDFWVIKVDAQGNSQWNRSFGGTGIESAYSGVELSDGNLLLGVESDSGVSGNKTAAPFGLSDWWFILLDASGNELWQRSYGTDANDTPGDLYVANDGGIYAFGELGSGKGGTRATPSYGFKDFGLLRLDEQGNVVWEQAYGGNNSDLAFALGSMPGGGLILGGYTFSGISGNKLSPAYGNADVWMVGVDAYGARRWEISLGGSGNDYFYGPSTIPVTADGGFIVAAASDSPSSGNKGIANYGGLDFWLVKLAVREAPPGTPALLVDGYYSPANAHVVTNAAQVELQSTFTNSSIYYTLDGSDPHDAPLLYSRPFTVTDTVLVRAFAARADFLTSSEMAPTTITVRRAPNILLQPQSQTVLVGAEVLLFVDVGGTAPFYFQWLSNSVPIAGATASLLVLGNLSTNASAAYAVVVTNAFGAITSSIADIIVRAPPSITTAPLSAAVTNGGTVTFTVRASGSAPIYYQWRKNGATLPGATSSNLIINPVRLSDGGSYTVLVINDAGTVEGGPAVLTVTVPIIQPNDSFSERTLLTGLNNLISGSNVGATTEAGEGSHAGQPAQRSVWYRWIAPANGIVRIRTTGSTFDTVLAIYRGTAVNNLTLVAEDEDLGGFLTSAVTFNATNGVEYQIVVDGFAAATGTFILEWLLEPTVETVPEIVSSPSDQTVQTGQNATFVVTARGSDLRYQWLFNNVPINNATNSTYTRTNVQLAHVGFYSVRLSRGTQSVTSAAALLEIGPFAALHSRDKIDDLLAGGGGGGDAEQFADSTHPIRPAAAFTGPVLGQISYNVVVNSTNNYTCGRNCEGYRTVGARWLVDLPLPGPSSYLMIATNNPGQKLISVCFRAIPGAGSYTWLGCSNGVFQLTVTNNNTVQLIVGIHSLDDATVSSNNRLDWICGQPPTIGFPSTHAEVALGSNLTLTASIDNHISTALTNPLEQIPDAQLQWYLHDQPLENQTNRTLTLRNAKIADGGQYSLVARNALGSSTNRLTVQVGTAPVFTSVLSDQCRLRNTVLAVTNLAVNGLARPELTNGPSYQWYFDQAPIARATNAGYSLNNVQLANAGLYRLIASNRFGLSTSAVNVAVGTLPAFSTVGPTGQWVRAGTTLTLLANATNGPVQGLPAETSPPLLLWLKDKTVLSGPPSSALTLENVSLTQAGAYRAMAINCFGAVTSPPVLLEVFSVDTQPILGLVGSSVVLGPVILTSSNCNNPSLRWRHEERQLNLLGQSNPTYSISALQLTDAGHYRVTLSNCIGVATALLTLQVAAPSPPFAIKPGLNLPLLRFENAPLNSCELVLEWKSDLSAQAWIPFYTNRTLTAPFPPPNTDATVLQATNGFLRALLRPCP